MINHSTLVYNAFLYGSDGQIKPTTVASEVNLDQNIQFGNLDQKNREFPESKWRSSLGPIYISCSCT